MCFVSCDASPDLNQTLTSLEAYVTLQTLAGWQQTVDFILWIGYFISSKIYIFGCCLHQVLEKKVVVKSCTVYCNCVCWEHDKGGWKVLLFSVALDTHLLSVPIPITSHLGHRPFSASEPFRFVFSLFSFFLSSFFCTVTWPWHSAENCLSEMQ